MDVEGDRLPSPFLPLERNILDRGGWDKQVSINRLGSAPPSAAARLAAAEAGPAQRGPFFYGMTMAY